MKRFHFDCERKFNHVQKIVGMGIPLLVAIANYTYTNNKSIQD